MNRYSVVFAIALLGPAAVTGMEQAAKGLPLAKLPEPVRKAIQENLKGGEIKNIGKEKEDGIVQYEVETVVNGHVRDFNVDSKGNLLVVEEPVELEAIPAAAKAGILKKSAGGKLISVETFLKTGRPMMYEGIYADAKGKKHEVLVTAEGAETKQ
jgi:hypothetical protein